MQRKPLFQSWEEFFTLKRRIILIFAFSLMIMFLGLGAVSYFAITSILTNKMNASVESNLTQIQLALLNNLSNLNHVSQQFDSAGSIGMNFDQLLASHDSYEKSRLMTTINANLSNISFSNPGVGLVMYYFANDHTTMLEHTVLKDNFDPGQLPLIAKYYRITYYGPHISQDRNNNQYVLSALRKINLAARDDAYVYVETGFKLTQNILGTDRAGTKALHLLLDNDGRIAYSEAPEVFPVDSLFGGGGNNENRSGQLKDYYWFKAVSNQGWSIVSVIPVAEYNQEKDLWIWRMAWLLAIFLGIDLFLALLLWDFVYRPLGKFEAEIKSIEQGDFQTKVPPTRIPEFDLLLREFQGMKQQILNLIAEVGRKEKRRADLEIEKLLYQINPHFLMNTLDTAHWLAVMNNQDEIDRIIQTLNKLLSYNLGKKGSTTTIADEIEAVQQYMRLQQIRHEFDFDIQIRAEAEAMRLAIPRFILQPIVENAIYHGVSKNGVITVTVELRDRIEISICDNGAGMTEEKMQELLNKEHVGQEKVGMGIGMNYVKRILEAYYVGQAELQLESQLGKGTSVCLRLPVSVVEG